MFLFQNSPARCGFLLFVCAVLGAVSGCAKTASPPRSPGPEGMQPQDNPDEALNGIAEKYVHLVLKLGRHDADYVDAFYGPPAWRERAEQGEPALLEVLRGEADALTALVAAEPPSARRDYLHKQLVAVAAHAARLAGDELSLEEELHRLYDIELKTRDVADFESAKQRLDELLPGDEPLAQRLEEFEARFYVPAERNDEVVAQILRRTRRETAKGCALPKGESFTHELVSDKPWGGYNWYKGRLKSLIQINTDLPVTLLHQVSRLAHEGYPGHHTYNSLLEHHLVEEKGWIEYTVYPLYSPQSVIAEGTANLGMSILFPDDEAVLDYMMELAPTAGLDDLARADFEKLLAVQRARGPLDHVGPTAARMLLSEGKAEAEVVAFIVEYGLRSPERASKTIAFIRKYRSYLFNYTAGEELVREWIGDGPDRAQRFYGLLDRPSTPSMLRATMPSAINGAMHAS